MSTSTPAMRLHGIQFSLRFKDIVGFGKVRYVLSATCFNTPFSLPSTDMLTSLARELRLTGFKEEGRTVRQSTQAVQRSTLTFLIEAGHAAHKRAALLASICVKTRRQRVYA
jgi:acetamidase/formamidase